MNQEKYSPCYKPCPKSPNLEPKLKHIQSRTNMIKQNKFNYTLI